MATSDLSAPSLVSTFSVHLIFDSLAPYLSLDCGIALGQTCKLLRTRVWEKHSRCFRYIDLSGPRPIFISLPTIPGDATSTPIVRHLHLAESREETREKWYVTGLYRSLKRLKIMPQVHTLILDGHYILFPLLTNLLVDESHNIRILSIRSPRNSPNDLRLQKMLESLVNHNTHQSPPMLETLYYFGPSDSTAAKLLQMEAIPVEARQSGVTSAPFAQIGVDSIADATHSVCQRDPGRNIWYETVGRVFPPNSIHRGWAECIFECEGVLSFDAVLCRGPTHGKLGHGSKSGSTNGLGPRIADISFGSRGCEICGTCPEGPAIWGESPPHYFPALSPIPSSSSSSKAAQTPPYNRTTSPSTILRCSDCMKGRWCEQCNKWWCETCYKLPEVQKKGSKHKMPEEQQDIKVSQGLCVEKCLVDQWMNGAGSGGMWG